MISARLVGVLLIGALLCGCQSAHHMASPRTATATTPAPIVNAQPLPIRLVKDSQPTNPDMCPTAISNAPMVSTIVLVACDISKTHLYTLLPEEMRLGLAEVDRPKPGASGYGVNLVLDASSAAAWSAFMPKHLLADVTFLRDNVVLESLRIMEPSTTGRIVLDAKTSQEADQLFQLASQAA